MIRPSGRFPANRRVRKRSEFLRVQSSGRRVSTRHFFLVLLANGDTAGRETGVNASCPLAPARLGVTASRRVGCAVVRNRAKRLIREAFRATPELWSPGVVLVVVVRTALAGMKLADVVAEWRGVERAIRRRTVEAYHDLGQTTLAPEG